MVEDFLGKVLERFFVLPVRGGLLEDGAGFAVTFLAAQREREAGTFAEAGDVEVEVADATGGISLANEGFTGVALRGGAQVGEFCEGVVGLLVVAFSRVM